MRENSFEENKADNSNAQFQQMTESDGAVPNEIKEKNIQNKAETEMSVDDESADFVYRPPYTSPIMNKVENKSYELNVNSYKPVPQQNGGGFMPPENVNPSENGDNKKKSSGGVYRAAIGSVLSIAIVFCLVCVGVLGAVIYNYNNKISELYSLIDDLKAENEENIYLYRSNSDNINEIISTDATLQLTKTAVVDMVSASVVEITTEKETIGFLGKKDISYSAGSGVIIAKGSNIAFIVTNYHVIEKATKIFVTLANGKSYVAEFLGKDESLDIAVLSIEAVNLPDPVLIGYSKNLKVGEEIIAIGNPLGTLGGTVTDGIISALDREITIDGVKMVLLQINAAVNPGNSGGGLFNMYGELVGIVNAKQSAEGIEGLGFAIPVDYIYDTVLGIIKNSTIVQNTLNIQIEYKDKINQTGVYVVSSSNPLFEAGDRIISIDGNNILTDLDYYAVLKTLIAGDFVTVAVLRNDEEIIFETEVFEYIPKQIDVD